MDEQKMPPGFPGDRSQAAAEKLRALRERANLALDDHRRRLNELETQLNQRVKQLADEFDAEAAPVVKPVNRDAEVADLHRQLEEGRAKHEKFVEQLSAARRQLDALDSQPCASCQQAATELAAAKKQVDTLRGELDTTTRQLKDEHARQDKFAEQLAQARQALNELQSTSGDRTAELGAQLEAGRVAQGKLDEQLAAATRDLQIAQVELDAQAAKAAALAEELAATRAVAEEQRERAEMLDAQVQADRAEIAQLTRRVDALTADGQAAQEADQSRAAEVESLEALLAEAREQVAVGSKKLAEVQGERDAAVRTASELEEIQQQLDAELAAFAASGDAETQAAVKALADEQAKTLAATEALAAAEAQTQTLEKSLAAAQAEQGELERARTALETEKRNLEATVAGLRSTADAEQLSLAASLEAAQAEAVSAQKLLTAAEAQRLAIERAEAESIAAQGELRTALEAATAQLDDLHAEVATAAKLQTELNQAQAELVNAQAEIAQLRVAADSREEVEQIQQKFDLALADVQKLKRDNASLREELLRRPAANEGESPELIAVRSERDVLAQRVTELEAAALHAVDPNSQQDRADLQRRFEMAVDDVRELKQENAKLRDKLAAPGKGGQGAAVAATGPLDWAAQRAKLMAMLEEEDKDGPPTAERKKERATIEGALAKTDRVLAEKDEEIAALRQALEAPGKSAAAALADQQGRASQEILDSDEVIAVERRRLAELQMQWEDKVRQAELEISVERAKLAREHASLKERTLDLQNQPPAGAAGESVSPRRRWLQALGLTDDDEQKKKKK